MRTSVAFLGDRPIFERPLGIVRPLLPDLSRFAGAFQVALQSGQVTNNGPWTREFERQLSDYLGVPTLVFCNGQIALMTMLRAAGITAGEVIVPSFTFAATPHAVRWSGATPVFADIADDGSFCLDPADVERKITANTVAILGVDAYGIPCDYPALAAVAQRHGLKVLYDSAPAFGSRWDQQLIGGFGDAQIFSFHATKAFATMEGGCLCSHDPLILQRAMAIRNFGQTAEGNCDEAGLNGKMTEVCALIGLEQLKTFDAVAERRRATVRRMFDGLRTIPGLRLAHVPRGESIWLYVPLVVDKVEFGIDRDLLATALEQEGLHVRKYFFPPCHHMTVYDDGRLSLPVTEWAAYNVIALPVYNDMTDWECDGIIQALADIQRMAEQINKKASQS